MVSFKKGFHGKQGQQFEQSEECMTFLIRHSERSDLDGNQEEKDNIESEIDPHITPKGIEEARITGKFLADYLI